MTTQDLIDLLRNPDPETRQAVSEALSEVGNIDDRMAILDKQRGAAAGLQNTPLPQGQHAGGYFIKSSPLEGIAAILRQGAGTLKMRGLNRDAGSLLDRRSQYKNTILQKLLRGEQPSPLASAGDYSDPVDFYG